MTVDTESLVVAGYATSLLLVATALDRLARHAQDRAHRYRTAGFRYHPRHDAWTCPRDETLWPVEFDAGRRLMRYRARPSVCNACPVKHDCTTSASGREIVRAVDPWPHSEAGRFHRGLALTLVALGVVLLVATAAVHRHPADLAVLAAPLLAAAWLGHRFTEHFRNTPANFPAATSATGLRVAEPSRTRWGSDVHRP